MGVTVRASGDLGGAQLSDIEVVCTSTVQAFGSVVDSGEELEIALVSASKESDGPMTMLARDASGANVVRLNISGNLWSRLIFQFGHEFAHVLAGPDSWQNDRFSWLEEAIGEAASLFSLRALARVWASAPPFAQWQSYGAELARYATDRMNEVSDLDSTDFAVANWLDERLGALEEDDAQAMRLEHLVLAKAILPIFEGGQKRWRAIRVLHRVERHEGVDLARFLDVWRDLCTGDERVVPELFGVALLSP